MRNVSFPFASQIEDLLNVLPIFKRWSHLICFLLMLWETYPKFSCSTSWWTYLTPFQFFIKWALPSWLVLVVRGALPSCFLFLLKRQCYLGRFFLKPIYPNSFTVSSTLFPNERLQVVPSSFRINTSELFHIFYRTTMPLGFGFKETGLIPVSFTCKPHIPSSVTAELYMTKPFHIPSKIK